VRVWPHAALVQELAGLPRLQPPVGSTPVEPLASRKRQLAPAESGKPRHHVLDQRTFVRLDFPAAEPPRHIVHGRLLSTLRLQGGDFDLSSETFNKWGMLPLKAERQMHGNELNQPVDGIGSGSDATAAGYC
jgi:hypothetical protein